MQFVVCCHSADRTRYILYIYFNISLLVFFFVSKLKLLVHGHVYLTMHMNSFSKLTFLQGRLNLLCIRIFATLSGLIASI